jgi:chemotaxis protein histidine kinase CheA
VPKTSERPVEDAMTDATADELQEFLAESEENLDRFDHDLLALEADPHDIESIGSAFRAIHTLKGTCGFLGFARLEALAHDGETLLAKVFHACQTTNFLSFNLCYQKRTCDNH